MQTPQIQLNGPPSTTFRMVWNNLQSEKSRTCIPREQLHHLKAVCKPNTKWNYIIEMVEQQSDSKQQNSYFYRHHSILRVTRVPWKLMKAFCIHEKNLVFFPITLIISQLADFEKVKVVIPLHFWRKNNTFLLNTIC